MFSSATIGMFGVSFLSAVTMSSFASLSAIVTGELSSLISTSIWPL